MGDWIKLHRLLTEWEWFTTPNMVHFWIYCLLKASHKDISWKGKKIGKGQFISGRFVMSAETGLSERSVRTCIARLKSTNEMTSQSTNEYTVFTINSWNKYQINESCDQQNDQRATNERPASDHIQEGKEGKEVKKNTEIHRKDATHPKRKFEIPEFALVAFEAKSRGSNEAESFYAYYKSNGWKVGKNPMVDWKSALVGWISRSRKNQKPDVIDEIKRVDELMRKQYGIETAGKDHPRAAQPMLCSATQLPETGDSDCGDSDNWQRMHGDTD